ncbi:MAG: ATP-dependent Clp protease proteolytic subunit [Dehalococcoidia bacterium]
MPKVNRDDVDRFFQYGLMPSQRTIYVGEIETAGLEHDSPGVDYRLTDRVLKGIMVLTHLGPDPITLILNNPGGNEYQGLAIYDAIRATPCHVEVRIMGHAMSMAAWFSQAADTRIIYPNATMMIHYGEMGFYGHTLDLERFSKESSRLNRLMEDHFLERIKEKLPKYTRRQLREKMLFDWFINADEALELGLVDEIFTFPERS